MCVCVLSKSLLVLLVGLSVALFVQGFRSDNIHAPMFLICQSLLIVFDFLNEFHTGTIINSHVGGMYKFSFCS